MNNHDWFEDTTIQNAQAGPAANSAPGKTGDEKASISPHREEPAPPDRSTAQPLPESIEAVLLGGDLSKLTAEQRLIYYRHVCESLGLNAATRPFEYILLNRRLTLYCKKEATEQLRKIHGVSITALEKMFEGDLYIVTAKAQDRKGRVDAGTGAVNLVGLRGEDRANAIMKAETKAKRRVTLSIAGLGWLDESEVDSIPGARPGPAVSTLVTNGSSNSPPPEPKPKNGNGIQLSPALQESIRRWVELREMNHQEAHFDEIAARARQWIELGKPEVELLEKLEDQKRELLLSYERKDAIIRHANCGEQELRAALRAVAPTHGTINTLNSEQLGRVLEHLERSLHSAAREEYSPPEQEPEPWNG